MKKPPSPSVHNTVSCYCRSNFIYNQLSVNQNSFSGHSLTVHLHITTHKVMKCTCIYTAQSVSFKMHTQNQLPCMPTVMCIHDTYACRQSLQCLCIDEFKLITEINSEGIIKSTGHLAWDSPILAFCRLLHNANCGFLRHPLLYSPLSALRLTFRKLAQNGLMLVIYDTDLIQTVSEEWWSDIRRSHPRMCGRCCRHGTCLRLRYTLI